MINMINVVQYGVGAIGSQIAKLVLGREGLKLVGAVDKDKKKVGRDLGELLGKNKKTGVKITDSFRDILTFEPDIILHSTSSHIETMSAQIEEIVGAGIDVISTAEELAYPFLKQPEKSAKIDKLARGNETTVLGTGVNPGFIMDLLPLVTTGACQAITNIKVKRIVNAKDRRKPLQEKIGVGLFPKEFDQKIKAGGGHVGLVESVALIAKGLNWELDDIKETIEPVIATTTIEAEAIEVKEGKVIGLNQVGTGMMGEKEVITLDLRMYLGADSQDQITISGIPDIKASIKGGIHGDIATPAVVVNSIPQVLSASPGLLTILDLPIISAWSKLKRTKRVSSV